MAGHTTSLSRRPKSPLGAFPQPLRAGPVFESLEGRRLLSAGPSASLSGPILAAAPADSSGGTGGTTAPAPVAKVLFGPGTPVGKTVRAQTGVAFSGEVGSLRNVRVAKGVTLHSTINWGDGTDPSAGTLTRDAAGTYHVKGSHTYADAGTYTITIQTTGSPATTAGSPTPQYIVQYRTIYSRAIVTGDPAPGTGGVALDLTAGVPFNGSVGSFTFTGDATTGQLAATISWGDGTTSAGTVQPAADPTAAAAGRYDVIGSHTYQAAGKFPIVTNVTFGPKPGSGALFPTRLVAIIRSVARVAPSSGGVTLNLTAGVPFKGSVGSFTFTGDTTAGLAASIDWGDGTTSDGSIQPSAGPTAAAGRYDVIGSHTYQADGTYPIVTTVTFGPPPGSGLLFPTRLVATIHSIAKVAPGREDDGSAEVVDGILVVKGTAGNDNISVGQIPGPQPVATAGAAGASAPTPIAYPLYPLFVVNINGHIHLLNATGVTGATVDGLAGNDNIDLSGTMILPPAPVTPAGDPTLSPPASLSTALKVDAVVHGGDGNDILKGGDGNDDLFGDDGDDILRAGPGKDNAHGGAGEDTAIQGGGGPTIGYVFATIDPDVEHVISMV